MKIASLALLFLPFASGQILSITFPPGHSYSGQLDGRNGWINNGNYSDEDTTRAAWCPGNITLVTGNDGAGPNSVFGGLGRAVFITAMGDFTTPAAGVTQTVVNGLSGFGHSSDPIFGNGNTMKSNGIDCQSGVTHTFIYQQDTANNPNHGSFLNDIRSWDGGSTWAKPADIDSSTGLPTSTSATGDAPGSAEAQFTADIRGMYPIQYCMDGTGCVNVDGNNLYKYGHSETRLAEHSYVWRILLTDYARDADGTHYQWYKGSSPVNDFQTSGSWDVYANALPNEPARDLGTVIIVSPCAYIPLFHRYIRTIASGGGTGLYQGPTPAGPWSLLYDFTTPDEGWFAPVIKSMTVVNSTTVTMNWLATFGPPDHDYLQADNLYNPVFHVMTLTGPPPAPVAAVAYPITRGSGQVQIKPQAMPTALTVLAWTDAWLRGVTISNTTSSAITALVQDGQGSPIPFLGTVSIAAHRTEVIPVDYWCPGGFSVQAGGVGLNYYATWRQ